MRAGDVVEVRWSGLPADADELELLLSVDGGSHFALRLTEELDGTAGTFSWRVPNLAAPAACIAVRMGIHGREILGPAGPLFGIAADRGLAGEALELRAGELWISGATSSVPRPDLPPADLASETERLSSLPRQVDAISTASRSAGGRVLELRPHERAPWNAGRDESHHSETAFSPAPLSSPRRN